MKVVAFAATTSRKSINRRLAAHAAALVRDADVDLLDLNDFELPLFSVDVETEIGSPPPRCLVPVPK